MSLSDSTNEIDVAYVARLARLHLTKEEVEAFQAQLGQVVHFVETLSELDLSGVEPTTRAVPLENVLRADEIRPGLAHEQAMANAPEEQGGHFLVPRVVE